jgi:uncharacterized protein YwgA
MTTKPDTFITGGGIKAKEELDQDLTDEALLRQYEELAAKDLNFGKKKKKVQKKGQDGYYDLADELLEDLDQHERDMNEMFRFLEETHEMLRNG